MWIGIISIFPEMFDAIQKYGITKKAIKKKIVSITIWNPRDFTKNIHHKIDDRPYGGGAGMVMTVQPLKNAIQKAQESAPKNTITIYLSPQGKKITQEKIDYFAKHTNLILVCGRYEGIDERIIEQYIDVEWSIGDYIVSGGELPAMIIIDAICRLQPGLLNISSIQEESFNHGLLDYPNYTRPKKILGKSVPKILLSGHHENIKKWQFRQSLKNTILKRPDLLKKKKLSVEEEKIINQIKKKYYILL
ncbi:tRNA (guanosine(37)-N1)-methyltransferase TrmD [Buchnera aphidicola]|uniref:tRNA (guanosine(37)-N1)-methyltransferase TrmD n=1 Tax=Buchnera aphidicola TaxID=9 RepID=UPI0031B8312D